MNSEKKNIVPNTRGILKRRTDEQLSLIDSSQISTTTQQIGSDFATPSKRQKKVHIEPTTLTPSGKTLTSPSIFSQEETKEPKANKVEFREWANVNLPKYYGKTRTQVESDLVDEHGVDIIFKFGKQITKELADKKHKITKVYRKKQPTEATSTEATCTPQLPSMQKVVVDLTNEDELLNSFNQQEMKKQISRIAQNVIHLQERVAKVDQAHEIKDLRGELATLRGTRLEIDKHVNEMDQRTKAYDVAYVSEIHQLKKGLERQTFLLNQVLENVSEINKIDIPNLLIRVASLESKVAEEHPFEKVENIVVIEGYVVKTTRIIYKSQKDGEIVEYTVSEEKSLSKCY